MRFTKVQQGEEQENAAAGRVPHKGHTPLCCRPPPKKYPAWPRNQFIEIFKPVLLNDCVKWKRN